MADENTMNEVSMRGVDAGFDRLKLVRKMDDLNEQKSGLERENGAIRSEIGNLTSEVQKLRNDKVQMEEALGKMQKRIDESESDRKAKDSIAVRATELETEVSRLQNELISSMAVSNEATVKLMNLKGLLEEKVTNIEKLEKEKAQLHDEMEKTKAEAELMAVQLSNESTQKTRVVREADMEIQKKECEISGLRKRIEELESVVANNLLQLEKMISEKKNEVVAKDDAIEALQIENEEVGELELKVGRLMEELDESKRFICELKDKKANGVNGIATSPREDVFTSDLKVGWPAPAIAVATGTIVAVSAVVYLRCAKRT